MAEKRGRQGTRVPFVNDAAAEPAPLALAGSFADSDPASPESTDPEPAESPAELLETKTETAIAIAMIAQEDAAATTFVDAEPAPAPAAVAPVPMVAAAAIPEPALPAPATIQPAFPPPAPRAAFAAAAPFLKGFLPMATAPDMTYAAAATTDKFQSMFGDVNERAKSAVEKTSKMAEDITELAKGNVEAFVASGRVAAKGAEAMTQEVAEYSKKSFESATGAMKSFAAVKSPTELFQLQSEFAKSSFESMVAEASKVSESMLKLMGEIAQPLSSRYAVAAEKLKASASL